MPIVQIMKTITRWNMLGTGHFVPVLLAALSKKKTMTHPNSSHAHNGLYSTMFHNELSTWRNLGEYFAGTLYSGMSLSLSYIS
jgi:hypothetical protein